ncbi:hypothetical protein GCM10014719_47530 [Planomonospora parontospora subsp. antibiotica]|nr:hypothetical protein GCM10014719_47530 [Planomonospora parontospora subsp. antibiotica]GII18214.1 hypothetical protein Ppa05_49400 [Planomonospora parontospora subsp. antibiotica]
MRYALVFRDAEQAERRWEAMDDDERDLQFEKVDRWFAAHASKITAFRRLKPVETATTVRWGTEEGLRVIDGPFCEDREAVSGYVEVDAAGLDEVLTMLCTWPGATTVEVRPVR